MLPPVILCLRIMLLASSSLMIDGVNDAFDGLKVTLWSTIYLIGEPNFVFSASFLMEHEIITQMRDNDREKWQVHQNFIVVISTSQETFPFLHM